MRNDAEVVWDFLKIEDPVSPADAIFILGGSSLEPVRKAASLYMGGASERIAFISIGGTFGGEKLWGMPEHEKYRKELVDSGVPDHAIVSEGISTNTLEEAKAALPFLRRHGIEPRDLILVSRPVHQRRAYLTFRKQHPDVRYVNCPADERFDPDDLALRKRMSDEMARIRLYSEKGDIEAPVISPELAQAASRL